MARLVFVVLLTCCMCGCFQAPEHVYQVCYDYDGATAQEADEGASSKVVTQLGPEVVRTVAEDGKLSIFLRSSRMAKEVQDDLDKIGNLPVLMSTATIHELPKGLPPKPLIIDLPEVQVQSNEKSRSLGVSAAEIAEAILTLGTKDAEVIKDEIYSVPNGEKIRFGDLGEISIKMRPSHIVRDYENGVARKK